MNTTNSDSNSKNTVLPTNRKPTGQTKLVKFIPEFFGKNGKHLNKETNNVIKQLVFTGKMFDKLKPIGEGAYGDVYSLTFKGNNVMYIIKISWFQNEQDAKIFKNEANVGFTKGIEKTGPKTIGVTYLNVQTLGLFNSRRKAMFGGALLMEHFLKGDTTKISMPFVNYMKKYFKNSCPHPNHRFYVIFKKQLKAFYKTTKGYHGDLHGENIHIILSGNSGDAIENVIIADYGAHKKFKTTKGLEGACLIDIFKQINVEFKKEIKRKNGGYMYPPGSNIHVLEENNKQSARSNVNMLKKYAYGDDEKKGLLEMLIKTMPNNIKNRQDFKRFGYSGRNIYKNKLYLEN